MDHGLFFRFFGENFSEKLQQIAVFFEVGGLLLVLIEIYTPRLARNIENFVDQKSRIRENIKIYKIKSENKIIVPKNINRATKKIIIDYYELYSQYYS
jgi:hypothetical protein